VKRAELHPIWHHTWVSGSNGTENSLKDRVRLRLNAEPTFPRRHETEARRVHWRRCSNPDRVESDAGPSLWCPWSDASGFFGYATGRFRGTFVDGRMLKPEPAARARRTYFESCMTASNQVTNARAFVLVSRPDGYITQSSIEGSVHSVRTGITAPD
jgi:hypothetical protein